MSSKLNGKSFNFCPELGVLKVFSDLKSVSFGLDEDQVGPFAFTQEEKAFCSEFVLG
jgi:hypothetical protein